MTTVFTPLAQRHLQEIFRRSRAPQFAPRRLHSSDFRDAHNFTSSHSSCLRGSVLKKPSCGDDIHARDAADRRRAKATGSSRKRQLGD
ncbi:hypothetical protein GJ744_007613 [Endocarpon pusillum]|uniref:Uncharacterized protein n=1 Tax=Endocarpon pusillum TaxID=364733 RepID=A0A8H7E5U9_9EURO|nr:hypothetical protein GJ744_007613 [Endocarpon pusillum]